MTGSASLGAVVAAGYVALAAMFSVLDYYRTASDLSPDPYGVVAAQERFRDAAVLLPPGAVVGYLSDLPLENPRGSAAFLATQYALAPRILVELHTGGEAASWVVGNYSRPVDSNEVTSRHNLTLVRDCGRGVILFRRTAASK